MQTTPTAHLTNLEALRVEFNAIVLRKMLEKLLNRIEYDRKGYNSCGFFIDAK